MKKLAFREKNLSKPVSTEKIYHTLYGKLKIKALTLSERLQKTKGSGIVYVRSRKKCKEVAELLVANGISADFIMPG